MGWIMTLRQFVPRRWLTILKVTCGILVFYVLYRLHCHALQTSRPTPLVVEVRHQPNENLSASDDIHHRTNGSQDFIIFHPTLAVGDIIPNCGLPSPCEHGSFSVHVYTGKDHDDEPRLCVDGKYVLGRGLNGGGRGINIAVVDSITQTLVRVGHFDTYEGDSTGLETLLLTLRPGDIIILLTFDEPTKKLSHIAKLLLYELGSALAQNLQYRSSWYLVSQKGMVGFSPFEDLHMLTEGGWAEPHDTRFCVPLQLKGQPIHPDPLPRRNKARQEFCEKHHEFPYFCEADVMNDPLVPAPAMWPSSISRSQSFPIIIISGSDPVHLPLTLETLIRQPGINPGMVVVFTMPKFPQLAELIDLFGFMSEEFTQLHSYCERILEAFEVTGLLFPDSKHLVLIEEDVVLAPDFLTYFSQLNPLLDMDPSIIAISAWNDNGCSGVSGNVKQIYRVEGFHGVAMSVRKGFFQKQNGWCPDRLQGERWISIQNMTGESIVPDVSRVLRLPAPTSKRKDEQEALLGRERITSLEAETALEKVECLHTELYEKELHSAIANATPLALDMWTLAACSGLGDEAVRSVGGLELSALQNGTGTVLTIYYEQKDTEDYSILQMLCRCFGLFVYPDLRPRNLHNGLLRFSWEGKQVMLIGSASSYYSHKPSHLHPLSLDVISAAVGSYLN